jgi:hypothetical protein
MKSGPRHWLRLEDAVRYYPRPDLLVGQHLSVISIVDKETRYYA